MAAGVEAPAVLRGHNHRHGILGPHLGDEVGEDLLVPVQRHGAGLLVVVVELHEEEVAGLDDGHDLGEALLALERRGGLAGLGVVGDHHAGQEEARKLLPPGGPGLAVLIDHGGVAGQIDHGIGMARQRRYGEGVEAGVGAVELEGELIVPVQVAELALLQADAVGSAVGVLELWYADVDVEVFFQRGVGLDGNFFQHQPAGLGADRDHRLRRAAEQYLHAVVALGDRDGEEEGLVGRAGPVLHLRGGPRFRSQPAEVSE